MRGAEAGFSPHDERLWSASGSCESHSPQKVIKDAGISHRAPWIIHEVAAEPFFPSTKSIGGPRAFSSMNMLMLFETSVKTHTPLLTRIKTTRIANQNAAMDVISPIFSPHSLVASVSIVPNIANTPIIAPKMKNQMPESKTPSKTGRIEEMTGRSLLGNRMPYSIKKTILETKPITSITHDEEGSPSPCKNSPIKVDPSSDNQSPRNCTIPTLPPEICP